MDSHSSNKTESEQSLKVLPCLVHSRSEMAGRCFYLIETIDHKEMHFESKCRDFSQGEVLYLRLPKVDVVPKAVMQQMAMPDSWQKIIKSLG